MPNFRRKTLGLSACLILAFVGCAAAFWGCTVSTPKPNLDSSSGVHFDVYDGGKIAQSGQLAVDSPPVQNLKTLLTDESVKWSKSYVTYVPGIAFKTDNYSVAMQRNTLILNYKKSDGNWVQVTRDIPPDAYDSMRAEIMKQK